jgi:hypothetical protein
MSIKVCIAVAATLMVCRTASGQQKTPQNAYTVVNRILSNEGGTGNGGRVSNDGGAGGIHLNEADGDGIAWINGREFKEGVIEFDIKGKDAFQKSFVGFAFHGLNDTTYEVIYFRPFNFRSTDPVRKAHAVQYIANPGYDWPKLRADYPNKYEQPVAPAPDPDGWFHAKISVTNQKISVFVNGDENPCLTVVPLVHTPGRRIGYWVGNGSGGDWKNLRIR